MSLKTCCNPRQASFLTPRLNEHDHKISQQESVKRVKFLSQMAHVITYDGVESVDGGTIFADKRFWVAQRVPMRSMFVDMIKVCMFQSPPPVNCHTDINRIMVE